MENVNESPKFFSRRLTNDMREQILRNAYAYMDKELANSVLMAEALEAFKVVENAYYKELYKLIPKEDLEVLKKYGSADGNYARVGLAYDYKSRKAFKYDAAEWNGMILSNCPKLYTISNTYDVRHNFRVNIILSKVYEQLGIEFMDKFYRLFDNIACEDKNAKAAIRKVVYSATTTGKLVEAYPYMEKFIPENLKTKENRNKTAYSPSVATTDVDIAALLK